MNIIIRSERDIGDNRLVTWHRSAVNQGELLVTIYGPGLECAVLIPIKDEAPNVEESAAREGMMDLAQYLADFGKSLLALATQEKL